MPEINVKLGINAYDRAYAGGPVVRLENRFVEKDGTNLVEGHILLARPGTTKLDTFGSGAPRGVFSRKGAFDDDLFVIGGDGSLTRYAADGTKTAITGVIGGSSDVKMALVTDADTDRLYFSDGQQLQYYDGPVKAVGALDATAASTDIGILRQVLRIGNLHYAWGSPTKTSQATLTLTANPAAGETVTVGFVTYTFETTPTGPNEVKIGAAALDSLTNLVAAITFDDGAGTGEGTTYGTGTVANPQVTAALGAGTSMVATSLFGGNYVNFLPSTETLANGSWDNATLYGGGDIGRGSGAILTMAANPAESDTVHINGKQYQFNAALNSATSDYSVLIGASTSATLANLAFAINAVACEGSGRGTLWTSSDTLRSSKYTAPVTATVIDDTHLFIEDKTVGEDGSGIALASSFAATWTAGTLTHAQNGSAIDPYLAELQSTGEQCLAVMAKLLNNNGTPGTDYTSAVTGADPSVSATSDATTLTATSRTAPGTSTATTLTPDPDSHLAWGASTLQLAAGATYAQGVLTYTPPQPLSSCTFSINGTYYSWSTNVATAGQDGTSAHPYLALESAAVPDSLQNMVDLLNFGGTPGAEYTADIKAKNPNVSAAMAADGSQIIDVTARTGGIAGNAITTTVFAGSVIVWGNATLTGGAGDQLHLVPIPEGDLPNAVASSSGFLLVSVAESDRFYWILPGATSIDALNFATAEFAPDNIVDIVAVADQVWILGDDSIEVWYATNASDSTGAFAPVAGRAFATGVVEDTAVNIRDTILFVGSDHKVYASGGGHIWYTQPGGLQRISTHAIEEIIREELAGE